MGLRELLKKSEKIFLDTLIFIYHIDENPKYIDLVDEIFKLIDTGRIEGCTSIITLLEVLVRPFQENDTQTAVKYKELILNSKNLDVLEVKESVVERAAKLRAEYKIKTPDAIQVASAILNKVDIFISNDKDLERIKEVDIITLDSFLADK